MMKLNTFVDNNSKYTDLERTRYALFYVITTCYSDSVYKLRVKDYTFNYKTQQLFAIIKILCI